MIVRPPPWMLYIWPVLPRTVTPGAMVSVPAAPVPALKFSSPLLTLPPKTQVAPVPESVCAAAVLSPKFSRP
jgi:hypothetical protein